MDKRQEFIELVSEQAVLSGGLTIVGIGTDKWISDSYGPITAQLCKEANLKNIKVRGCFGDLFDALTIKKKVHTLNGLVVAMDACIGKKEDDVIYRIDKCIKPGLGVGKDLESIGKHSIVYVSAVDKEIMFNHDKKIGDVYFKSKETLETIKEIDKRITLLTAENLVEEMSYV